MTIQRTSLRILIVIVSDASGLESSATLSLMLAVVELARGIGIDEGAYLRTIIWWQVAIGNEDTIDGNGIVPNRSSFGLWPGTTT